MTTKAKRPAIRCLAGLTGTPWAITEGGMRLLLDIAARENLAPEALEAERGAPLDNAHDVTIREGVATIPVTGPLFRYADFFTRISGATSYDTLATDLTAALEDPAVGAIILSIDSPGGEANGVAELAAMIRAASAVKPVVAYVGGLGASAAYWIASAATEIVANEMAILGSIGVVFTVRDARERDAKAGIRTIQIVSSQSPRKRLDPAEDDGRAAMQVVADQLAEVFVGAVAGYRGVSVDTVLADFGQGDVMVGAAAVSAGLADRLGSYEAVHAELAARVAAQRSGRPIGAWLPFSPPRLTNAAGRAAASSQETPMSTNASTPAAPANASTVATQPDPAAAPAAPAAPAQPAAQQSAQPAAAPTVVTAAAVREQHPAVAAELRAEGATAERTRILGIQALARPGRESVIAAAVNDPACTVEGAKILLFDAERAASGARLAGLKGDEAKLENKPGSGAQSAVEPNADVAGVSRIVANAQVAGVIPKPAPAKS